MPNHITNAVTIKGDEEAIRKLKKRCIREEKGVEIFDFNGIIPQPDNIFLGDISTEKTRKLNKQGIPNWYDWNSINWGTKWGAYDFVIKKEDKNNLHIEFNTAWSPPQPIFDKLIEEGFELSGLWKDEGHDTINEINNDCGDWSAITTFEI